MRHLYFGKQLQLFILEIQFSDYLVVFKAMRQRLKKDALTSRKLRRRYTTLIARVVYIALLHSAERKNTSETGRGSDGCTSRIRKA